MRRRRSKYCSMETRVQGTTFPRGLFAFPGYLDLQTSRPQGPEPRELMWTLQCDSERGLSQLVLGPCFLASGKPAG